MTKTFIYTSCFIVFVHLWNGIVQPFTYINETIRIGIVLGNKPKDSLQWTQEQILQTTINRLKIKSPLLKYTNFVFHYVHGSNVTSVNDCLKLLNENLLPQQVQAIIVALDDYESEMLSLWASLVDLPVLGTARRISLSNKKKYKDFHYLLPSLNEESMILQRILSIIEIDRIGIIRGADQESIDIASSYETTSKMFNFKHTFFYLTKTKQRSFKFEAMKVLINLELHSAVRVIVMVCNYDETNTILEAAKELGLLSDKYLWIATERILKHINRVSADFIPLRMIGIRLNVTEDEIAFRAAKLILGILESKLLFNCSTNNIIASNITCMEYSNVTRSMQSSFPTDNNYDILVRSRIINSSYLYFHHTAKLSSTRGMSSNDEKKLSNEYNMKNPSQNKAKRLRVVTIEHGQYTYQVSKTYPKCPPNNTFCKIYEETCYVGIPCTKHIPSGNNSYFSERICVAGLMIELLYLLQDDHQFSFDMYIVKDSKYGGYESGRWNGMIGDIIKGHADIALATLTTTSSRSRVVDFTFPYGKVGIGLLTSATREMKLAINFDFLLPFTLLLWSIILVTIVMVWTLIWVLDKISAEWYLEKRENLISNKKRILFLESMSFSWSTFVHVQAGRGVPQSYSARILGLFFAFTMVIISSSYTAELAAHKVKEKIKEPITGIFDEKMLNPPKNFKYGTLKDSSTEAFFKFSEDPRLRKIYQNMKGNNVDNVEDGVKKLVTGEFKVYIDDRPYLEHLVSSRLNCSLRVAGNSLGESGYAIALSKNSNWTRPFSLSIMKFNDNNILQNLWAKWLKRKCISKEEFGKLPSGLTIENVNGLFLAVVIGIVFGIISLTLEYVAYFSRRNKQKGDVTVAQGKSNHWPAGSVARAQSIRGIQLLNHSFNNSAFVGSIEYIDGDHSKHEQTVEM